MIFLTELQYEYGEYLLEIIDLQPMEASRMLQTQIVQQHRDVVNQNGGATLE